jgi:hypothetical protein
MPDAIAAPLIPDMRAWLSLVGIPILQAINAHMTTAQSPAHRAGSAVSGVAERSAMPKTVFATRELISAIPTLPTKLQIADNISALLGESERVDTQLEMAFGATVQPLTNITAIIRIMKNTVISYLR